MKNKNSFAKIICRIFGHKERCLMEQRYHSSGVHSRKHSYEFGGVMKRGNKGRWVWVSYHVCSRCGKKLDNARRVY